MRFFSGSENSSMYLQVFFNCYTQLHVREPAKFKHINRQWNRNKNGLSK